MNNKLPYKGMADQVASRGRYGDTTLMHVNPIEVQGLASLAPLTINPDTGYPEAFLPLLAPFLGTALGTALGGAAGLSGLSLTAAGAAGSGLATTAVTGSVEEGLMAGLTGFGLGSALQGTVPDFSGSVDNLTLGNNVGDLMSQGYTQQAAEQAFADQLAKKGVEVGTKAGTGTLADLGTKEGFKNFAGNLTQMENLIPTATGLGGIAVTEDMKEFEANNLASQEARDKKKQDILDSYTPSAPGMGGSVYTSRNTPGGTQSPFSVGGNNQYNKFDNFAYHGGRIENSYANGGQVERKMFGGDLRFSGIDFSGIDFDKYFDKDGNYIGNTSTTGGNTTGGNTTGGNTTDGTVTIQSSEDITPTDPTMPDISNFSLGYDPTRINMATGDYYTDEEMAGKIRGRGLTPVPYDYMPGFMPEYQYVSNIQPTSTIGGGDSSQQYTIGSGGTGGIPNVVNIGGQNVYKGSYNPDLFAGGTPYNEYLLGNVEKGIPAYLSSYMQNTPYYQYQDQQLNSIFGGGGYGTPGFGSGNIGRPGQPVQPLPNPEDINPLQSEVDSLNKRVEDLLAEIDGKDSTIATELAEDQASRFGQITPDSQSDLIVQEGDNAGQLNVEDNLFDYLSPTQKEQYTEYDYLGKYLNDLNSFGEGTAAENFANYVANTQSIQEDTAPGGLISENIGNVTNLDSLMNASGTVDPNTGNTILYQVLEGGPNAGSVTRAQLTPGGSYAVEMIYDLNADGTVNLDSGKPFDNSQLLGAYAGGRVGYASGGQILNSIKTLENYTQPLPTGGMEDNLYAVGGEIMQSSDTVEIDGQIIEKSNQVETVLSNPVIQEKMPKGDRELLEKMSYVILGRLKDDGSIMQEFIRLFGEDAYAKLKAELMPLPQQEGMIEGEGGGMDDKVNGVIGDQEQVAVSPGEYIVPADVVGNLGDGNSEEGARIMDDFLSRVRTEKHDTEKQPDPINLDNVMPA